MTDQWGPTGDDDEGTGPPPPPPPPGGQTPIEPVLSLETEGQVTRSGGAGARVIAGVVGVLALVGGTLFAVSQLGSSGPESPEAAVAGLLDAVADEDVLGLLASLDPGERETLRGPVEDLFDQLERLEVVDDSFALDGVAGIDLAFDDVTFRTEPVRDDLARVYFTGGTVSGSVDASEMPIGDFISDTLDRFGADVDDMQVSDEGDIAGIDTFLVARNGSDGWRVSIGYTAAENARLSIGLPVPADPIAPIGADSPEAAVEGLLASAATFDLRAAIARLSPDEFRALHDYGPLFVDDAAAALAEEAAELDVSIDDLVLGSDRSGDRASVSIDEFAVTVTSPEWTVSVAYADECFEIAGDLEELSLDGSPFADGPICIDELPEVMEDFYGTSAVGGLGMGLGMGMDFPTFPAVEYPTMGISTARVDGQWFVAPIATGLDAMVSGLELVERSHLEAIVDFFDEMQRSFEESFTYEEFDEVGEPLVDDFYEPGVEPIEEFPTTTALGGTTGTVDEAALQEFVSLAVGGSEESGRCVLEELSAAPEHVRYELADAFLYDYEPSVEAQDAFYSALEVCLGQ